MAKASPQLQQQFVTAQQLAQAGRHGEAQRAYREALSIDPGFVPAMFALGQSLAIRGDSAAAFPLLASALDRSSSDARARSIIAPALAAVLEGLEPIGPDAQLEKQLLACLAEPIDPQPLARLTAELLRFKYRDGDDDAERVGRDPLWLALLTRMINTDGLIEARLVALRRSLLEAYAGSAALPASTARGVVAIALQALSGEFVWPVSDEEQALLADGFVPALVAAMYRPLGEIVSAAADAKALRKDRLSGLLVRRGLAERADEAARTFEQLDSESDDEVSAAVRAQYEDNPYPRWTESPAPRVASLFDQVSGLPGLDQGALGGGPARVLIAGCGTGYELAGLALSDPQAHFIGLDLSRASLAHAARKAEELGLANIRFVQGDILDAEALGGPFDLIYSTGVLHHMAQPADGLAALVPLLRPGGAIRVGLYSRRARSPINAARELIAERGWAPTVDGIRGFRAEAMAAGSDGSSLAALRDSPDFNSLSGCRDLVFHVQEHQIDVPQAAAMLENAGLTVAGIEPRPDVLAQFLGRFGNDADLGDLGMWDQLEAEDPSIFAAMILMWGQKPLA